LLFSSLLFCCIYLSNWTPEVCCCRSQPLG
jgi:hypothetical protein